MSSRGMPFTTLLPTNGGTKTGLSVATSGERAGAASRSIVAVDVELRAGTFDSEWARDPTRGRRRRPCA